MPRIDSSPSNPTVTTNIQAHKAGITTATAVMIDIPSSILNAASDLNQPIEDPDSLEEIVIQPRKRRPIPTETSDDVDVETTTTTNVYNNIDTHLYPEQATTAADVAPTSNNHFVAALPSHYNHQGSSAFIYDLDHRSEHKYSRLSLFFIN